MRNILPALFLSASMGLAAQGAKAQPIPDRSLGLSKTSVFDVPSPPAFMEDASAPGENALPPRPNRETPPVISHGIGDFLPITRASNLCLDCHAVTGPKKKGEPTPVPASHFVDFRHSPKAKGAKVVGARWVCTACHVPQTDAMPLVGMRRRS